MSKRMRFLALAITPATLAAFLLGASPAPAADDTKVKGATQQVETGAKKIGDGEVGKGVEESAKGVGKTVEEGAKYTGEKFKEAGKAAEPSAKNSWQHVKEGASSFGHSVKSFFTKLFD
ncbi:MAG TPA: hypothetical protein VFG27_07060 [Pseudomonadales bacterium]|nr:hypothetical protein [Pseudomonadales bacterium]